MCEEPNDAGSATGIVEVPMNCPHLNESPYLSSRSLCRLLSCKANREVYIPSLFELDQYCKHRQHTLCPFYSQEKLPDSAQPGRSDA